MPKSERFWRERTSWPAVHYMCATALIASDVLPRWSAALTLLVAYLLLYVFESFEAAAGLFWHRWRESKTDGVISDIVIGSMAVTTFFLIDELAQFDPATRYLVPQWLRVVTFVVLVALSPLFDRLNSKNDHGWRIGLLGYGCIYTAIVIAVYVILPALPRHHSEREQQEAAAVHGAVWAIITGGVVLVNARASQTWSTFMVVFAYAAALLLLVTVATLVSQS